MDILDIPSSWVGNTCRCCSMCVSNHWLKVGSQANDAAMIVQPGMLLGLKDEGIFVAIGGHLA